MMNKLFELLSSIRPLTEGFRRALKKKMVPLTLPKNYLLVDAGTVAAHAHFLNTGFAMSFRFIKGNKQVEEFFDEGKIIVSPKSFFEQVPSKESIQLLEESEVLVISYENVMQLLREHSEADIIYRATMNLYYEESRERIHDFQHLSAVERYEKLIEKYSRIEQIVPQEFIASYLGIAPQSLSRIKRDLEDY